MQDFLHQLYQHGGGREGHAQSLLDRGHGCSYDNERGRGRGGQHETYETIWSTYTKHMVNIYETHRQTHTHRPTTVLNIVKH
jgi:hypothetical protein